MKKLFIPNRHNQKLSVVIEGADSPKGLVFIMHGLSGFKEQVYIRALAKTFLDQHFCVVTFDVANTIGESDGKMEDASVTSYYKDLEDVIAWSTSQEWYQEPFVLCGHSYGGLCTALYAEHHPDRVRALAPISAVVSGQLSATTRPPEEIQKYKQTGWYEKISTSKPGTLIRIKWADFEDRMKYDLLSDANKLTMPVLLMVGDEDMSTPVAHQQKLFDSLPGKKEMHSIKGAPHSFRKQEHIEELQSILKDWIVNI